MTAPSPATPDQKPARDLPVFDLSHFAPGHPERQAALAALRGTARNLGFFYLEGHGVAEDKIDGILDLSRRFFSLPEADKMAIEMRNSSHFRGYNRAGLEVTRGAQDWREQVDFGPEREKLAVVPDDQPWLRLVGPNQFPDALPEMRAMILDWIATVTALGIRLIEVFAEALGQDPHVFQPIYRDGPNQLLKLIRYPGRDKTASDQGVGAHKDGGFVTVLLQDKVGGLQVDDRNGGWIDAPPRRGSFVINVGELFEMASGGYLLANIHRVVTPPAGGDRLSVAFFLGANLSSRIPLLHLPDALADDIRGVTQDPGNPLFREVGRNALKSRLRSHPDVAALHHPDLVETILAPQGKPA